MTKFTDHIPCGHGWVYPNAMGIKADCGGPSKCKACAEDARVLREAQTFAESVLANQYSDPNAVLAQMMDAMKGQLLIVMVNRMGGKIDIPVAEIDATGQWMMHMAVNQETGVFTFTTSKKS